MDTVFIENPWNSWIKLGQYVKDVFKLPTIAITGSAGKTTTTMLAKCVFDQKYKTFISGENGKNFNTPLQIVNQMILRCDNSFTFHVQECGGETPNLIKSSSEIIRPDLFGINNIDITQHIATYESVNNLVADKTSFDRLEDKAIGVINIDDDVLCNYNFQSKIITYAINNKKADYVAENINQIGNYLTFDVVSNTEKVNIKINIIGKYNVYNALMVFAFAKHYGLTNEEIQKGFLNYESVGIRQNLTEIAGRIIYMDAYNSSVESANLAVESLSEIETKPNSRKIAVIGERKTYDDDTYKINYNLGKRLAKHTGIDKFFIVGEDTKYIIGSSFANKEKGYNNALYQGYIDNNINDIEVSFTEDLNEIIEYLKCYTDKDDIILFKGRAALALWSIPDLALGSSFSQSDALIPLGIKRKTISSKESMGLYSKYIDGIALNSYKKNFDNTRMVCPEQIDKFIVRRINEKAFKNNTQLKSIIFNKSLNVIENEGFFNCINIEELYFPLKLKYIGKYAFANCTSLVFIQALSIEHIGKGAFKDCKNLKNIFLSEVCMSIDINAFNGCNDLCINAPEGSIAHKYAIKNNIKFKSINADEEINIYSNYGTRKYPLLYGLDSSSNKEPICNNNNSNDANINLAFVGDIMIHDIHFQDYQIAETNEYNFDKLFQNIKSYLNEADISVGNLETTFAQRNISGFPKFNSPDELAISLKRSGFDIIATANNHSYDSGYNGIIRTKKVLEYEDLKVCGTKKDVNDESFAIIKCKDINVAILNYSYRTDDLNNNKTLNKNILDNKSKHLINTFSYNNIEEDLDNIRKDINKAKKQADIVIIYYHWGVEYNVKSNVMQRYIAYQTAQMGVDAIIGSHAHVIQEESFVEIENQGIHKKVPVFYGLGNFCWGGRLPRSGRMSVQNGILALLNITFDKHTKTVKNINTSYKPLVIKNDNILNHTNVNVLSLDDLNEYEINCFNCHNLKSVETIKKDIEKQLHPQKVNKNICLFENCISIMENEIINLSDKIDITGTISNLMSENAPVASVINNSTIIGNNCGYAGIKFDCSDGKSYELVLKVEKNIYINNESIILVNKNNLVSDIYQPRRLSKVGYNNGNNIYLEEKTAISWRAFLKYGKANNYNFDIISGYLSYEGYLRKQIDEKILKNQFDDILYSNYNFGVDSQCLGNKITFTCKNNLDNQKVKEWLILNACRFGFYITELPNEHAFAAYYLSNIKLATIVQRKCKTLDEYFLNKNKFDAILQSNNNSTRFINKNTNCKLTLKKMCELINIDVPYTLRDSEDTPVSGITLTDVNIKKHTVFVYDKTLFYAKAKCRNAMRKGAIVAITDELLRDEYGNLINQILVDDSWKACSEIGSYVLQENKINSIVTIEKESSNTFTNILNNVLSSKFNILSNNSDSVGRASIINTIMASSPNDDYYIQRLEGYSTDSINSILPLLKPIISIIVDYDDNIAKRYGKENDYLNDIRNCIFNSDIAIVNIDEPKLNEFQNLANVITVSTKNKEADYFMSYICSKDHININILQKKSQNILGIRINKKYMKNINYILAAYAVGMELNLSTKELYDNEISKSKIIEHYISKKFYDSFVCESINNSIKVSWIPDTDVTGYHVRCYTSDGKFIKGMHVYNKNTFTFKNLKPLTKYIIKIRKYTIVNDEKQYGLYYEREVSTGKSVGNKKIKNKFIRKIYKLLKNK